MPKSRKHSWALADVTQGKRVPSLYGLHRTSCCEFPRRGRLPEHLPPLNHAKRKCGERRQHGLEQASDTSVGPPRASGITRRTRKPPKALYILLRTDQPPRQVRDT